MAKNLVIVESPAKAKTISKMLGNDYVVRASFGHIRDLSKNNLGFDPQTFKPEYIVSPEKKKVVSELRGHLGKDTTVYLASDEDREGEAISWHLIETLKLHNIPTKRIVFHEITKSAITHAINNPRPLDMNLVDAQQARRVMDRGIGFTLSPLLWKKVKYGLSAGRVQSVALRIVVDREDEINAFTPEEFWKLKLNILSEPSFTAELHKINGVVSKVANEKEATDIKNDCDSSNYILDSIEEKEAFRNPPAPYTTSSLQQDASSKIGLSPKLTMSIAQKLYEGGVTIPNHTGGLITYMRTDSVTLSTHALDQAKELIVNIFGKEYGLSQPRTYNTKAGKVAAQEAHEAIRPVNLNLKPSDVKPYLDNREYKLYSLIWSRTVATQMQSAKVATTTYKINGGSKKQYEFTAKGTKIIFPGFMKASIEDVEDQDSALESKEKFLPNVPVKTVFDKTNLVTEQNFTKPPARYTEASLIKKLEVEGIGRPSTYAATLSTIVNREYVIIEDKKLVPTTIGTIVTNYLKENFPEIVDLSFTSNIEAEFDKIASGEVEWTSIMHNFYDKFVSVVKSKEGNERVTYMKSDIIGKDEETGLNIYYKEGQHGAYLQVGESDRKEKIKPHKISPLPRGINYKELDTEKIKYYLKVPRVLGVINNVPVNVGVGKFGPFLEHNKSYYSIKPSYGISVYDITLEQASDIIETVNSDKAKAILWSHEAPIFGGLKIIDGKYGIYLDRGGVAGGYEKAYFKIPKTLTKEDIAKLTLDDVIEIMRKQDIEKNHFNKSKKKNNKRKG